MKPITRIVAVLLIFALLPICGFAAEVPTSSENIIYLEDGSYLVVEIFSTETRATSLKTGGKSITYNSSQGEAQWKATILGNFSFNGTTSTCTDCSLRVDIYETNWYEISQETSYSGNTAYAELTMGRKLLGIKVGEETVNITLTCDKNGNLS